MMETMAVAVQEDLRGSITRAYQKMVNNHMVDKFGEKTINKKIGLSLGDPSK